jgi:hypothetical protein
VLEPAQETATYDLASPFAQFVGAAEVTLEGSDVHVIIPDPDDPENPTTFDGTFSADSHCVAALVDDIAADLCFFNTDGRAAQAETLGALLYGFLSGAPTDEPNAGLIAALRRDVAQSCSPGGFFVLDASQVALADGDLTTEVAEAAMAYYLSYLAVFPLGGDRFSIAMGTEPVVAAPDSLDSQSGAVTIVLPTGFAMDIGDVEQDFDADIALEATIDAVAGTLSGTVNVTVSGGEPEMTGVLTGEITGQRN